MSSFFASRNRMIFFLLLLGALSGNYAGAAGVCNSINPLKLLRLEHELHKLGYELDHGSIIFPSFNTFVANPQGVYGMYSFQKTFWKSIPGTFTLGPSDGVLFLGCAPPPSKYWSLRSYLMTKQGKLVFASLGDSLNQLVAKMPPRGFDEEARSVQERRRLSNDEDSDRFNNNLAILTTADSVTFKDVQNAINSAQIPVPLNLDSVPAPLVQFAQPHGDAVDLLGVLFRVTIPLGNLTEFQNYVSHSHPWVWMLKYTGKKSNLDSNPDLSQMVVPRDPYPVPKLRSRVTHQNLENDPKNPSGYIQALDRLKKSVKSRLVHSGFEISGHAKEKPIFFDGFECVEQLKNCAGDNHDSAYSGLGAFTDEARREGRELAFNTTAKGFVLIGVNHHLSKQAIYANIGLSKASTSTLTAIPNGNINDLSFPSSVGDFLPEKDSFHQFLFVVFVLRDCNVGWIGSSPCISIPSSVLADAEPWVAYNRVYLNPTSKTGPSSAEILPYELIVFH